MSPNLNSDDLVIARQLMLPKNLTYPTVYKHRIFEATAEQRKNLFKRLKNDSTN